MALAAALMLAAGLLTAARPLCAAPDAREMQARHAYAGGNYRDAVEIYIQLYAEKLHPNYLRNIGRCYQNLGEPDKAINSFREYLRKGKDIRSDERAEVNGYMAEMEELKKRKQAETAAAAAEPKPGPALASAMVAGAPPVVQLPPPLPAATPLAKGQQPAPMVNLSASPRSRSSDREEASPIYARWWFWAAVGGVMVTGVGVAAAGGLFTKTVDAGCQTGRTCPPQ